MSKSDKNVKEEVENILKQSKKPEKPTTCHCCGKEYRSMHDITHGPNTMTEVAYLNEIFRRHPIAHINDTVDTYLCTEAMCRHIYRHYYPSAADFHAGEYREDQLDKETGSLFKKDSIQQIQARKEKSFRQLTYLKDFISSEYTALEVASGRGYALNVAKEIFKSVTGSDIDPKVVDHNKIFNPDVEIRLYDILKMPEEDKYDVIMAFDVLEHIEEADKFASKMYGLANKYVMIQVPVDRKIAPPNFHLIKNPEPHHAPFDGHVHYFTEHSLNNLFTKDGMFKCVFMYKTERGEVANGREIMAVFEKIEQNTTKEN